MLIKGPAFVIWLDEFNIYRLMEFSSCIDADEFVLDLVMNPKNRIVFKNFDSDGLVLSDRKNEEAI
jgi:hypothetical protein